MPCAVGVTSRLVVISNRWRQARRRANRRNELVSSRRRNADRHSVQLGWRVSDFAIEKGCSSSPPSLDRRHHPWSKGNRLPLPPAPFQLHAGRELVKKLQSCRQLGDHRAE